MSSLSQKDKNTLIIAGIALLIVGIIILGIKPAFTGISETKATNKELSAQKATMKTEIESLPTYQTNLATAKADYATTGDRVFDCYTNDLIHDETVALVQGAGLSIESFTISSVQSMTIAEYKIYEDETATTEGGEIEGAVKLASISVSVSGTENQIITLLDTISKDEGVYLNSVTYSPSTDVVSASLIFDLVIEDTFA